jgi:putative DNA primase/helicase
MQQKVRLTMSLNANDKKRNHDFRTLDDLEKKRIWVCWYETAEKKPPINAKTEKEAKVTGPDTWTIRAAAQKAAKLNTDWGIGVVLGALDNSDYWLCGIDLDRCLSKDGSIDKLAEQVIKRFNTYAEISPSGEGIKLFFLLRAKDAQSAKRKIDGRSMKSFSRGDHQEIAIAFGKKYYTVTDHPYKTKKELTVIPLKDVTWLLDEIGPEYKGEAGEDEVDRSTEAVKFFGEWRSANGDDYDAARRAILQDDGPVGDWARKWRNDKGDRQIKRAWKVSKSGSKRKTDKHRTLETICLADVRMEGIDWLWPLRLAVGKVTMLSGDPGIGKSHISIDAAARISTGSDWPLDGEKARRGSVIILAGEDAPNDTIRPRLEAAGADCKRVCLVKMVEQGDGRRRLLSLRTDLDLIEKEMERIGDVRLIIIDPVSAYLGDDRRDPNQLTTLAPVFNALSDFAERTKTAVLVIHHPTKSKVDKAIHSMSGSLAFSAGPRIVFIVAKESEDSDRCVLLPVVNKIGPTAAAVGYRIVGCSIKGIKSWISTSRIEWDNDPVEITANQAVRGAEIESKATLAKKFLNEMLSGGEPIDAKTIFSEAKKAGIGERTMKTVKASLGIEAFRRDGRWWWELNEPKGAN